MRDYITYVDYFDAEWSEFASEAVTHLSNYGFGGAVYAYEGGDI